MATSSNSSPPVLHADREHDNLRTVVVLFLIAVFFFSYWLVYRLLQLEFWGDLRDYAVSLSCVLGLILALAISAGLETWLKRVWPSGRSLILEEDRIRVHDKTAVDETIRRADGLARLCWYFSLQGYRRGGREKRISPKWLCLACQLQQGETRLIVHTYLPPQKASAWLENNDDQPKFHEIRPVDVYESSFSARLGAPTRPHIGNEVLAGKDGRYWLAERHRWDESFELTPNDFATLMDYLARGERESDKIYD